MTWDENSRHVEDRDLRAYVVGNLGPAEAESLERHMLGCSECKERLEAAARSLARNNRVEPRLETSGAGILRSFSPLLPERWPVEVVDVSKNGMGLLVPVHLMIGSLVQVRFGGRVGLGEVRYSGKTSEHQFRTGIRLYDLRP